MLWALVADPHAAVPRWDTAFGAGPEHLTQTHAWLRHLALGVQAAFTTLPMFVYGVTAAVVLALRRHPRTAIWLVVAMGLTPLVNSTLKRVVGRHRPIWPHPITTLNDPSFPSGHSSAIACAAVIAVLIAMFLVKQVALRRVVIVVAALLAVLVGADRVFLGVHNASDVLAGWSLGAAVALLTAAAIDPVSAPAPTPPPLPTLGSSGTRHVAVILNPIKVPDVPAFKSELAAAIHAAGWEGVHWHETRADEPGAEMAHDAAVAGAELVITCGGDGTVRAVCEELAGTGIPVGIVPAGTGNLLARNLDLPLNLRQAVEVAVNGQDQAIDLVRVTGDGLEESSFLVMAGMGFDAAIMEGVNESFKARFGWIAYVLSGLRSLMYPAMRVEVSVDGGPFTRHRARTVVLGNVGYLQAGMPLIPDAAIDDGQLDVVLLYPRRFMSWIPLAVRVLSKSRRTDDTITRFVGRTVTVRAAVQAPRQLDGDLVPRGRELTATVLPGRLLVRVPR